MSRSISRRTVILSGTAMASAMALRPAYAQAGSISIGTSSSGSTFYTMAVGMGEIIRDEAGINTTVEPVGGSAANVNGIGAANVDLALTNAFAAFSGYNGTFAFEGRQIDLRLFMQGHPSNRALFIRDGAGIEGPQDLEGKTIIGERRSLPEMRRVMDAIIEHYGLEPGSVNVVSTTNTGEAMDALQARSVDGAILPFSAGSGNIERATSNDLISFLPMSEADRDAMLEMLPAAFYGGTLQPDDFSVLQEPTPVFSLNAYVIGRTDIDDETAYAVAKSLFEHNDRFRTYHDNARYYTKERAVEPFALPYHPGVVQYLKEAGVWTEENEARQAELLGNS